MSQYTSAVIVYSAFLLVRIFMIDASETWQLQTGYWSFSESELKKRKN